MALPDPPALCAATHACAQQSTTWSRFSPGWGQQGALGLSLCPPCSAPSQGRGEADGGAWVPVTPCLGTPLPPNQCQAPPATGGQEHFPVWVGGCFAEEQWVWGVRGSQPWVLEQLCSLGGHWTPAHQHHINKGSIPPKAVPGSDCARLTPKRGPPKSDPAPPQLTEWGESWHPHPQLQAHC